MITLDVVSDLSDVKIMPANELEEIAQNVAMIMSTTIGTVPYDRTFGVNENIIDLPIAAGQAKLTAALATAIREQEPRARVQKVFYSGALADGQLIAKARIEIVESKLRGGLS